MLTRIAPTPSGFLHAGNRLNFQRIRDLAQEWDARVALRIDDADSSRYRREYVVDIFDTLHDMGISWDVGPRDVEDFELHWSQRTRAEHYRSELNSAVERGLDVYACSCSRALQPGPATGGCAGHCRDRGLEWVPGETALRAAVPRDAEVLVHGSRVRVAEEMGDVILWRRDDLPSYQLVSVIEDRDLGVTHVVRGIDLLPSTAIQLHLAPWLEAHALVNATFVHHGLVTDASGAKLSKSTLASGSIRAESP